MQKNLLILVLILFSISSCSWYRKRASIETFKPLDSTGEIYYSPVHWLNDSNSNFLTEKTSLFIPVKIKGIEKQVYMQLDLGAVVTGFYENTIRAFSEINPEIKESIIETDDKIYFYNSEIQLNEKTKLSAEKLYIYKNYGSNNIDSSFVIIGTIGYDIIGENVLILDFKNDQVALTKTIPENLINNAHFVENADLDKFPIILPFKLGRKKIRLFYDTGASRFPILTGIKRLKKIATHRKIDTVGYGNSWGKITPFYQANKLKIDNQLFLGTINLGEVNIYGTEQLKFLSYTGRYLYGITGNVIFDNSILIIDKKNNKFGIIK